MNIHTLLGVWAHPDDEAYCSSGLMAQVTDHGGRVVVVTATHGEHGTDDPENWPPERLAAIRRQELAHSLAEVRVHEHRWLRHSDGELGHLDVDSGADALLPIIHEVRPTVIVTFGPEGMTGHPDHRAISAWTTAAWHRSGRRGELWYATLTPEFHQQWGYLNREVGLWMPGSTPPEAPRATLSAHVRLSGHALQRKHRALRAHASQTRGLETLVGADRYRRWWSTESFVAADPRRQVLVGRGDDPALALPSAR